MASVRKLRLSGLALLVSAPLAFAHAADVLTQHYDNARTGAILDEKVLNTTSVKSQTFGKLWTLFADGQIVAQPLYVSNLTIDTSSNPNVPLTRGTFNAVIIATMHNTIYVYDADNARAEGPGGRTTPLWATWLGKPRGGGKDIDMWSTNDPEWGILGTPVISDDRKTLYAVAWHDDGGKLQYRLHALDLASGLERPPTDIGPGAALGSELCNAGQREFNPCKHKQRAALLLTGGTIYVGFGGDGNRGALFAFDAQTLKQQGPMWSSTPSGSDGGIWQSGQGPAVDQQGNVYLNTGNGSSDGTANFGNSTLKMTRDGQGLAVKDFFTPCNVAFLNSKDLDLGSAGLVLIPDEPPRIVTGGKEGVLYVLDRNNLGKHVGAPNQNAEDCKNTNIVQQVFAFEAMQHGNETHWGNIHGAPVYWRGPDAARIYVWGENSPLKAYKFAQGQLQEVSGPKQSGFRPPFGMPGGMLALSADGDKAGSGIVWAVVPFDGDANQQRGVHGIVLALDAEDVSRSLWTSEQVPGRDSLGLFAKFDPPLAVAGKVFVATYGDDEELRTYRGSDQPRQFPRNYYVAVYGLNPPTPGPRPVVNQTNNDIAVVRVAVTPLNLDKALCSRLDPAGTLDCTEALAMNAQAPSFHRVLFGSTQDLSTCNLVRVTTASRNATLPAATGIGFWSSQAVGANLAAEDSGRFSEKPNLKQVGTATLANGDPAILHQFVGVSNCMIQGTDRLTRLFKPYMRFDDTANGRIVQNWDVSLNYQIQGPDTQFDHSGQVLRP
ncbi:MAG: hypothetical protein QOH65_398 [Methylobacteriaceae bacterium]|jgi:hypothetical protein|nr:hypothetical protein [Methylobacteriaceae bacterium]